MRQVTVNVYEFEELQGKARERAADTLREWAIYYGWWDAVYCDAREVGKQLGFDDMDINFTGFWSQGDGASFVGSWNPKRALDATKQISEYAPKDEVLALIAQGLEGSARNFYRNLDTLVGPKYAGEAREEGFAGLKLLRSSRSRGCHESTVDVDDEVFAQDVDAFFSERDADPSTTPQMDRMIEALRQEVQEYSRDFMRWIYRQLEDEYNNLVDDENLREFAEANEYEFYEDGLLFAR